MVCLANGLDFALLVPAAGVTLPLLFAVEFALDEGSAEDPFCSVAWFAKSLQLINGSWTNASNIANTESLLLRNTVITLWQVPMKFPSIPETSIAFTNIRVKRNGTRSGNFSRCIDASKQSPKSICKTFPEYLSIIRLLGCRSPRPSK